jgi:hypothetical protein
MKKLCCIGFIIILLFFINTYSKSNQAIIKIGELKKLEIADSCQITNKIRTRIIDYINNKNELVYNQDFILSFAKINEYDGECYFPRSTEDINLYYYLGDSVLLKKAVNDIRAMKLLIDLYLVNSNNAELSEYYGFILIPKAACLNIISFIKVISGLSDKDSEKCIQKLQSIESETDKLRIRNILDGISDPESVKIVNKIKNTLAQK